MAALEPWPSLEDKEFIEFTQQYSSRLCKRSTIVLRKFSKGFIACKFSAFAYLLIGILWLDRSKSNEEKIELMRQFNLLSIGSFKNRQLENIFMQNKREDPSINISSFTDIKFEDDIALFGIVENDGYSRGEIYHYFLILKLPKGYFMLSSYGSDAVSIYQYKTRINPESFTSFVKSLNKDKRLGQSKKIDTIINRVDVPRIRGFMRAHFLNPKFKLHQRKATEYIKEIYPEGTPEKDYLKNTPKDIKEEIDRYIRPVTRIIQFQSILPAIQDEIMRHQMEKESYEEENPEPSEPAEETAKTAESKEPAESTETEESAEPSEPAEPEVESHTESTMEEATEAVDTEEAEEIKRKELESVLEKEKEGGTMKMRKKKTRKGKRKQSRYSKKNKYI